ncbi:DUF6452 family protein [Winogradskyella sp. UBA3174]|uniref:DUF6452 family protein n=1 Tax=Winogradskyella sp. UBA3174 TaxID=1947785 RepID=UPI0025D77440|nr:DUF6452 family protein [Winogradskyella sp. UBA3174]|tara:strand:- start:75999 stop:76604 length:606 start_codon:yes stop_codon:yes gene_type:complete
MKNIKFLILILAIALINCERDDICADTTSTTPRLIIEFYDATSTDDLKTVPRLTVYGEGLFTDENGVTTEPIEPSDKIVLAPNGISGTFNSTNYLFNRNSNTIELPLKIESENSTVTSRFILERNTNLRLDENTSTDSNIDILEISYIPEFDYVSRACGYKSIFTNLIVTRETDNDNWISIVEVLNLVVENENTVHVRIEH